MSQEPERVKADFDPQALQRAQALTWKAIDTIVARMEVGMLETDARKLAEETLKQMGSGRNWHKAHVRFGVNTLQTFADTSLPGVRLQPDDIFFLDLGPVWEGYEGDAGATYTVGSDAEMIRCAADARTLFGKVRDRWQQTGESGKALYQYAVESARERGWEFITRGASGHRIADFPHALYYRGSLKAVDFCPAAARWILEIQLKHPTRTFGAFYEDVLS